MFVTSGVNFCDTLDPESLWIIPSRMAYSALLQYAHFLLVATLLLCWTPVFTLTPEIFIWLILFQMCCVQFATISDISQLLKCQMLTMLATSRSCALSRIQSDS